jgi:hypothetical protein
MYSNIKNRGHKNSNPCHFHGIFSFSKHVFMILMLHSCRS